MGFSMPVYCHEIEIGRPVEDVFDGVADIARSMDLFDDTRCSALKARHWVHSHQSFDRPGHCRMAVWPNHA
jgi:hypothetical protein